MESQIMKAMLYTTSVEELQKAYNLEYNVIELVF